jgi:hypothetical protein
MILPVSLGGFGRGIGGFNHRSMPHSSNESRPDAVHRDGGLEATGTTRRSCRTPQRGVPTHAIQAQGGYVSVAVTDSYVRHFMPADVIDVMRSRDW